MGTKLNDNEVREIAEMQRKIDSYEAFITGIYIALIDKKGREIAFPLYEGINNEMETRMSKICEFVKQNRKT